LLTTENYDFILAFGDDVTDEDMFSVLNENNQYTIKVGLGNTKAKYNVLGVNNVLSFLNHLSNIVEPQAEALEEMISS
jgi:trehalose 6-phosphate synthase/phosphatase